MPNSEASSSRRGPPRIPAPAGTLECIRATRASLAGDRFWIEAARTAIERSRALLGDRTAQPGGPEAAPAPDRGRSDAPAPPDPGAPAPLARKDPALPAPQDGAERPDADAVRRTIDAFQVVLGLIEHRLRRARGAEAREALSALLGDVAALGSVQRRLAEPGPDGFAGGLADLGATWQRLGADRGVAVQIDAEPVQVGEQQAGALALAANELVTNSLKHAFPEGGQGLVHVVLRAGGGGWGELRIADDGRGLVDGPGPDSLGLDLLADLLRRVGGELRLDRADAVRASLRFPLAARDGAGPDDAADPPRPA